MTYLRFEYIVGQCRIATSTPRTVCSNAWGLVNLKPERIPGEDDHSIENSKKFLLRQGELAALKCEQGKVDLASWSVYNCHPVQEKTTLWVHPWKSNKMGSKTVPMGSVVQHPFCHFFMHEPIGSFSHVQCDCFWSLMQIQICTCN